MPARDYDRAGRRLFQKTRTFSENFGLLNLFCGRGHLDDEAGAPGSAEMSRHSGWNLNYWDFPRKFGAQRPSKRETFVVAEVLFCSGRIWHQPTPA